MEGIYANVFTVWKRRSKKFKYIDNIRTRYHKTCVLSQSRRFELWEHIFQLDLYTEIKLALKT